MEALKLYLEAHKVTQVQFAERIGARTKRAVSQASVSEWLSGRFKPSLKNLQAISAETGLSLDQLLENPVRSKSDPRERRANP